MFEGYSPERDRELIGLLVATMNRAGMESVLRGIGMHESLLAALAPLPDSALSELVKFICLKLYNEGKNTK